MKKYYYSSNGIDKNGPVTLEELKQIKIDPKTMVWFEGLDNWVNAEEINELNSLFTSPKINLDKTKLNKKNSTSTVANSKKKKRKWVLPIVILSLIIFSVIVRSGLKSNNSVVQEISVEKIENELENKYIEPLKIAEPENSYEEEQIKGMLLAEDDRNFSQVIKYYDLKNLKRYWNYNNPTYDQLKSQYEKSWNYTDNSSNTIKSIIKIKEKTYDVNLDFSYFHKKDNIYKVANSDVRFVFNDNAKIIEVYGVSEQNVEKKQDVIVADKAYFYLTPDLSSIKKTYLIKGDKFTYTNSDNEFVNATFTNSKGVTTNGWILESTFLDMESQSVINLNEKENNEVIRELGTSSFRIKINNNVKNLNIRNNPVDGDIIAKISGGEIYTVIKVFEASKPIYLLKNQMSFKDIETGEDIEKPNDYKLSNLRLIGDDLFYAEVFNSDNTFNKIHINKNNFKIEYNNWFYLKELKGWMYSKFGEKIVFRKDPVNNKDIDDQTKTEKN